MLMSNEEREILGTLPIGSAVVKLQGRWLRPFQISIPYQPIKKGEITDEKLGHLMEYHKAAEILGLVSEDASSMLENEVIELSEKEENFLLDILNNPFAGVVERYKRLLMSRRKGNTIKETCQSKNLIENRPN